MANWGRKKSNAKYFTFEGLAVYAKPYVPDEYNGKENWKVGLIVSKEEFQKIKDSGSQAQKKLTKSVPGVDDNIPFVTFKRITEKEFPSGKANFCPPVIYDKDGEKLVWYELDGKQVYQFTDDQKQPERKGEPVLIGNGSKVEVTVSIYPAGTFGKGTRLESIKIIDLIEYTPPDQEEKGEVEEDEQTEKTDKMTTEIKQETSEKKKGPGW